MVSRSPSLVISGSARLGGVRAHGRLDARRRVLVADREIRRVNAHSCNERCVLSVALISPLKELYEIEHPALKDVRLDQLAFGPVRNRAVAFEDLPRPSTLPIDHAQDLVFGSCRHSWNVLKKPGRKQTQGLSPTGGEFERPIAFSITAMLRFFACCDVQRRNRHASGRGRPPRSCARHEEGRSVPTGYLGAGKELGLEGWAYVDVMRFVITWT